MSDKPDIHEDEHELWHYRGEEWVLYSTVLPCPRCDGTGSIMRTRTEQERPIVWPVGMVPIDRDKK